MREIVLLGNPNVGKTTLFNALTGMRQATANYPGVTVTKKTGVLALKQGGEATVVDLPGTYSLLPKSLDEDVVHNVLLGVQEGVPKPDVTVLVVDANNLERNLYLASQVIEIGTPIVIALNMWDLARENGINIDIGVLEKELGVKCVPTVAAKGEGVAELKSAISEVLANPAKYVPKPMELALPEPVQREVARIGALIEPYLPDRQAAVRGEALRLLTDHAFRGPLFQNGGRAHNLTHEVAKSREILQEESIPWKTLETAKRYAAIERLCSQAVTRSETKKVSWSDRLDYIFTHPVWGLLSFIGLMAVVFQSIFTWAAVPMDWISGAVDALGGFVGAVMPEGALRSLVVDGMIAGVGNVVIFLPQIFILFFFIALFEDFGYMARAAFVLDRLMKRVGLNGKAFLPLLSCFACAIPGIMATRTIQDKNDRLATILVAPLISCSARLPVYALMIGAFIPAVPLFAGFDLKGITLLSMYLLSIVACLGMAALFRGTFLKGNRTPFVFELPPYRIPNLRSVFFVMWDRGKEFIYRAGTIIFTLSIVLWFLVSYPQDASHTERFSQMRATAETQLEGEALEQRLAEIENTASGEALRQSFAGRAGILIEPLIRPLGFDWKIGIGLIGSFAAREVLVSTLAIAHNVGSDADETSVDLIESLRAETHPETGKPMYTPLTAVSLMVFFVLACQCMSTIAVVRRETGTWRWPVFMVLYMTALAWLGSFATYQVGLRLGFG